MSPEFFWGLIFLGISFWLGTLWVATRAEGGRLWVTVVFLYLLWGAFSLGGGWPLGYIIAAFVGRAHEAGAVERSSDRFS